MAGIRLEVHHAKTPNSIAMDEILRALVNLNYGSVEIVVHGGRITQIERREKLRVSADLKETSSCGG